MSWTKAVSVAILSAVLAGGLTCRTNYPPDMPAVPIGPDYCLQDTAYIFRTIVTDPDGDSLAVRFDWGDSTTTYWVGWFASGETVAFTHAWTDTGTYEVRVLVQDQSLLTSDASDRLLVRVAVRWPPGTPAAPLGPGFGGQDSAYTFRAGADHPDNVPVAIRFAWGDGDTSEWSEFVPSGGPVSAKHAWSEPDTYAVTAQAKDTGELTSLWSPPHQIVVRPPDTLLRWRVRIADGYSGYLSSSPAIGTDGAVYVGSSENALYAVNPDGTVRWRYLTGAKVRSSPAIAADGTVYVGTADSCLCAVSPDGALAWRFPTGGYVWSSPAIAADGTIYFGASDNYLYALNPDGTRKWSFQTYGALWSSPAIAADGTVYFGSYDGFLYAVQPDGTLKWSCFLDEHVYHAEMAIGADGTIYCGTAGGYLSPSLYALRPDGSLRWSRVLDAGVHSSPAIAVDGTVYAVSSGGVYGNGVLYALNPDSTTSWRFVLGEQAGGSSPAVSSHGTIYFGASGGLYALSPDATLKWRYQTGGSVGSSPTIGPDGTVYFTCDDGYLYALKGNGPLADSPWPKFHHDLRNTGRTDQPGACGLRMIGSPRRTPDNSGFLIKIINEGTCEATISWLEFYATPESAYMRNFYVDTDQAGYPIGTGLPGTGPGDTVGFGVPHTIAPYGAQAVEIAFLDFFVDENGNGAKVDVQGRAFQFRFSDGSVITVNP